MAKNSILFLVITLFLASCGPTREIALHGAPAPSQVRVGGESFRDSAKRYFESRKARDARPPKLFSLEDPETGVSEEASIPGSSYDLAQPLSQLPLSRIPALQQSLIRSVFETLRDSRFLKTSDDPNFLRRESWLYPDDGCYSRAAVAVQNIAKHRIIKPAKLFVFGDLQVSTPNSPSGSVSWWYHVVPAYREENGGLPAVRVIDPAINPYSPMSLTDWAKAQNTDISTLTFSVCDPDTYEPGDSCYHPDPSSGANAISDEDAFLQMEWGRQEELGRDPRVVLGDRPPWS